MRIMRIIECFSVIPGIDICWYTWKNKRHYYVTFHWLFWYLSSLKEFEWNKKGGEE